MSALFLLGAGFSKAVSVCMPTMADIKAQLTRAELPGTVLSRSCMLQELEELFTYLFQPFPWKSSVEIHTDKAAFQILTSAIVSYISDCEARAFAGEIPPWARQLTEYFHRTSAVVVSLNYDTILERLSYYLEAPCTVTCGELYRLPLTNLVHRTGGSVEDKPLSTYHLIKLHGSINWFYPGDEETPGQQVYYAPVIQEEISFIDQERIRINQQDLVPFIIPPVAEKSSFYRTRLLRTLWCSFKQAVAKASEIYLIGYSLPVSDLTMELFFRTLCAESGKTVYIVNHGAINTELRLAYAKLFTGCNLDYQYTGREDAVAAMTKYLWNHIEYVV